MLVLSRKQGQVIVVGDIVITVAQIKGSRVRVGVDAPRGIPITRGELIDRILPTDGQATGDEP